MKANDMMDMDATMLRQVGDGLGLILPETDDADILRATIEMATEGVIVERANKGAAPMIEEVEPKRRGRPPAKKKAEKPAAEIVAATETGDDAQHTATQTVAPRFNPMKVSLERPKDEDDLKAALSNLTGAGLSVTMLDDDTWLFRRGDLSDSGTMHQPLRVIVSCAERLMRG